MTPAKYSFPEGIKKVGIVNNTIVTADTVKSGLDTIMAHYSRSVANFHGEVGHVSSIGKITAESLAKAIADQKYFDEVVICDSALRQKDPIQRERLLTVDEVSDLADGLDVDAILSVEGVYMKIVRSMKYASAIEAYRGVIDVCVCPKICVYVKGREKPIMTIVKSDTINWDQVASTPMGVESYLPNNERVISEAADFAGTIPVKLITPHWETVYRSYFSDYASTTLKNAALYVKNNQWDDAYKIWKGVYDSSKKWKKQMQMAHNIALYNEIKNDFDEAIVWETKARSLSLNKGNKGTQGEKELSSNNRSYYLMINQYLKDLKKRKKNDAFLNIQMDRFNKENK